MPYHLFKVLQGHKKDVRGVAVTKDGSLLSGSRDLLAKVWKNAGSDGFISTGAFLGHKDFITCVACMPPSEVYPKGLYVTGAYDNKALIFNPDSETPLLSLEGHNSAVTSLFPIDNSHLLTSSSDMTAKLWHIFDKMATVTYFGHTLPVWAVIHLSGYVVTGCADKLVRVFNRNGEMFLVLDGHTDCVRALTPLNVPGQFLSCGNDGEVRRWSLTSPICLQVYEGHSNLIFSIAASPDNSFFVSAGEESQLFVWSNIFEATTKERIDHPSQTIWSVAVLPNNDIVTGSSDGNIRIFSQSGERVANEEEMAAYMAECEKSRSSNSSKSSDFEFSIDVEDGKPPLKLNFNKGDDEYEAAKRFLEENNLPLAYQEQIVNFIRENTTTYADHINNHVSPSVRPQTVYVLFEAGNTSKIQEKLVEFWPKNENRNLDWKAISAVMELGTSNGVPSDESLSILISMLKWLDVCVFPVLDITRLAVKNDAVNNKLSGDFGVQLMEVLLIHIAPQSLPVNKMLGFRVICNMMTKPKGEKLFTQYKQSIYKCLQEAFSDSSKALQISVSTLILNSSVLYTREIIAEEIHKWLALAQQLINHFSDEEAIFRIVASLKTLCHYSPRSQLTVNTIHFLNAQIAKSNVAKVIESCQQVIQHSESLRK